MSENEQINRLFPKVTLNEKGEGACVIMSKPPDRSTYNAEQLALAKQMDALNDEITQLGLRAIQAQRHAADPDRICVESQACHDQLKVKWAALYDLEDKLRQSLGEEQ